MMVRLSFSLTPISLKLARPNIRLTRARDYAIRGMIYLAEQPEGKATTINEIADKKDIPKNFLSKVMPDLTKTRLVSSVQDVHVGYLLGKPKDEITLRDIVEVVKGGIFLNQCLIYEGECPLDQTCQVHLIWQKAQQRLLEVLEEANLAFSYRIAQSLMGSPPSK